MEYDSSHGMSEDCFLAWNVCLQQVWHLKEIHVDGVLLQSQKLQNSAPFNRNSVVHAGSITTKG